MKKSWLQYREVELSKPVAILIIRIALSLLFAAIAFFLSSDLLLLMAVPGFPGLMTQLGLAILLSAFALIFITGLFIIIKRIIISSIDYFSPRQCLLRKLWFVQNKQEQHMQLFYSKALQIHYFNEIKRKRLLRNNDRKHIQSLSKAIEKDLYLIKKRLSKPNYLQLQRENIQYRNKQDIGALLELQKKIAEIV